MVENTEIDAINHLLEVEKNASALINDAAQEADRRLSEARSKYNAEYKIRYDQVAARLEAEYQNNHQQNIGFTDTVQNMNLVFRRKNPHNP